MGKVECVYENCSIRSNASVIQTFRVVTVLNSETEHLVHGVSKSSWPTIKAFVL